MIAMAEPQFSNVITGSLCASAPRNVNCSAEGGLVASESNECSCRTPQLLLTEQRTLHNSVMQVCARVRKRERERGSERERVSVFAPTLENLIKD